jgi:hypothetical protein
MGLCRYRDALGKPGEGIHRWRIGGLALVDILLTLALAGGIAWIAKKNFWAVLLVVLILAIVIHEAFCVPTALNCALFGRTGSRAGCPRLAS